MFSAHRQTRRKELFPATGVGSTARMAFGSTRLTVAGAGFGAGGVDATAGAGLDAGGGAAGFGAGAGLAAGLAGAGEGAAAVRGSRTVFPHWPQELAPPPA